MKTSFRAVALRVFSLLALVGISSSAHAQATSNTGFNSQPIESFAGFFIGLINTVIVPVVFAIAFIVFLWGVFTYFIAGGANEEKRQEGAKFVFSAIIGFVIMVSIWGLVNLAGNLLPGMNKNRPDLPTFGPAQQQGSAGAQVSPANQNTSKTSPGNSGTTANPARGVWNLGDACSATSGCREGLSCVSGICRSSGQTDPCPTGHYLASGECDTLWGLY